MSADLARTTPRRPTPDPARPRWALMPLALAAASIGLAFAGGFRQYTRNVAIAGSDFQGAADRTLGQLRARFRTYEYQIRGARGAVLGAGGETITRTRFRQYAASRDVAREFPGSLGFGFIRRVPQTAAAAFVATARAEGPPTFAIRQIAPHDGDRFVIQYVEPSEPNELALGLDIASESVRREAALHAQRTGQATLTAPIDLLRPAGPDQRGFLLLLPVYRADQPATTEAERADAIIGWAYSSLSVNSTMAGVDHRDARVELRIVDRSRIGELIPVFSTPLFRPSSELPSVSVDVPMFGRDWNVEVAAESGFVAGLHLPNPLAVGMAIALIGLLAAAVQFFHLWNVRSTLAVAAARGHLASIIESSSDAIITEDLAGLVTSWNDGATRLFGYSAEEMIGHSMERLYTAGDAEKVDALRRRARQGVLSRQVDAVRVAKDGRHVHLDITKSPLYDAQQIVVGLSIIVRDDTDRIQEALAEKEKERRFRDLAESLPHMVWTCQGEGPCDYLSPQWVAYTGIPEAVQLGYRWLEQLHPDDVVLTKERWAAAALTGGTFDVEFRVRRHDGVYRWFKTRARPICDESGRILKWFGSNTDIQDLRDFEEALHSATFDLETRVLARTEELRTANTRLESLAKQLQTAQRIAQVGSWEFEVETGVRTWSPELHTIVGTDPQTPIPLYDDQARIFTPASWDAIRQAIDDTLKTGTGYELRLEFTRVDGALRVAIARGEAVRDPHGKIVRLVGTLQDVTEDEQVRAQLERLTDRLRLATSAAKMGVWDWNVKDNVLIWDEVMHRLYDTAARNFTGVYDAWRNALHPADLVAGETAIADALAGRRNFDPAFRVVRPSGEIRYMRAAATVHRDPVTGEPIRMVGVNVDITEQRTAELALRSSEALQRAILMNAGSAIIATDPTGTISLFNRAAEQLLGFDQSEIVGKATPLLVHDPLEIEARRNNTEVELGLASASPFDVVVARSRLGKADASEWTFVRKDSTRVPVLLTVSTLRDDAGEISGYLGIAVDLSAQKHHEGELRELNRLLAERTSQAESASTAKSMFLANMSHDIRTPIGAITGVTYLLGQSQLSDDQRGLVRTIERSSKTLLGMINDVLDLSKIEAGQLTLDHSPFHMAALLEDIAGLMSGYATGRNLELILDLDPDVPDSLVGDQVRLMQILTNLVGNAVKFTERGAVRLSVRGDGVAGDRARIRFEVEDTGPGIDAAVLPKLFAPFTQGDQSNARRVGGTGLGLAIVKQLATMMGGEVGVSSETNVGSRFWCVVPFELGSDEKARQRSPISVLVVDDHAVQRAALSAMARRFGWETTSASSGREALALVLDRVARPHPFDAVILDWRMPGMDGIEMLSEMRRHLGALTTWPTVVMATAHDRALLRQNPDAALADEILGKPVAPGAMFDAVTKSIAAKNGSYDASSASGRPDQATQRLLGVRILLVDDSDVNLEIARRILAGEGANVVTASDGREAVDLVLGRRGQYDVVLMDVQMPVMDGVDATRLIRQDATRASLPIIALTAGALATDRQRALETGMTDFVSKPYNPDDLIASVRQHIARRRATTPVVPASPSSLSPDDDWPTMDGVDSEDARMQLGGDSGLFRDLIGTLAAEIEDLRAALATPPETSGFAELARDVHKLKGAAGSMGARDLFAAATTVEDALRVGDVPHVGPALKRLELEMVRLQRSAAQLTDSAPLQSRHEIGAALGPFDEREWDMFIRGLREQRLDTLVLLPTLDRTLRQRVGRDRYEELRAALDKLDFLSALSLVESAALDKGTASWPR